MRTARRRSISFCTPEQNKSEDRPAAFHQPWMNPADIPAPPQWVRDTVWYQIFPDRFCRSGASSCQTPWRTGPVTNEERFGGDLPGICEKLDYLAGLGVNGLYLNPIFAADSVHKYDTRDYESVDPDFGTNEDLARLVKSAHERGIRVMLDAVFNHCGASFGPWQDVLQKGPASHYWNWFMVNRWPAPAPGRDTRDSRYYSFAFASNMPKLNTNEPEVIEYVCGLCERWVGEYGVDAIRFDVGNEVSHRLLKELHRRLRAIRPDVYLLGEIWHDASPWLEGDEYDAVMNYPLQQAVKGFFAHKNKTARMLAWDLYRCMGMYRRQTGQVMFNLLDSHDTDRLFTRAGSEDAFFQQLTMLFTLPGSPSIYYGQTGQVMFNLLDSHDTDRLFTRAGSEDAFFQQLTMLFTLPGSPSIYYGTEIGLPGGHDPDCRRCMPWNQLDEPENRQRSQQLKELIRLRQTLPALRESELSFVETEAEGRTVFYRRGDVEVLLNCGETLWQIPGAGEILFCRGLRENLLAPGGVCIRRIDK